MDAKITNDQYTLWLIPHYLDTLRATVHVIVL